MNQMEAFEIGKKVGYADGLIDSLLILDAQYASTTSPEVKEALNALGISICSSLTLHYISYSGEDLVKQKKHLALSAFNKLKRDYLKGQV